LEASPDQWLPGDCRRVCRPLRSGARQPPSTRRILLTSGKLFCELDAHLRAQRITDSAIIGIEQFYPIPHGHLERILQIYPDVTNIRWLQEEPANQGAWSFLALSLPDLPGSPPPNGCPRHLSAPLSTGRRCWSTFLMGAPSSLRGGIATRTFGTGR
jgi:2-oxoglutarate dehydrogenase complex dehydrogenase (E1) component-like enzyme